MRKTHVAPASRLLIFLLMPAALPAIDGLVTNATKGTPAAGIPVLLVSPSQQGMQALGSTKSDAEGKFSFARTPQGPALIQAVYQGVTYNKLVMPGAPSTNLDVSIYESTNKAGTATVTQHMILVQPASDVLTVNETYLFEDSTKLTYNDPANGTLQFYLPPETQGKVQVTVNAPGGMPVQRPAMETKRKGVYKVDYPIKPGETRIDLAYTLPAANPLVLEGKLLQKDGKARLVAPQGVTLTGANLRNLGVEPQTQASIYDIDGSDYKVTIQGTGSLQGESQQADEDSGQPQLHQAQPRIYDHIYWILALTLGILGLGSWLIARHSGQPAK